MKKKNFYISFEMSKLVLFSGFISLFISLYASDRALSKNIYLMDVNVTGYRFFDTDKVLDSVQTGEILYLKKQGNSPENSIQVYTKRGEKLGYLSGNNQYIPSILLKQKIRLQAVVKKIHREDDYKDKFHLSLYQVL
jgi:hypothetical protein